MNTIVYIALSILFFGCTFACGLGDKTYYVHIFKNIVEEM